jgi:hypothetical protein
MPRDESLAAIARLESWVLAYRAVEVLDGIVGPEALATGVAFVPSIADLIPRDAELRAKLGREIGQSLASAEHAVLIYALTRRLAILPPEDQAVLLRELWVESLRD